MPVTDTHEQYNKYLPRVQQVRDCVEGADAVKSRTGSKLKGDRYLPQPNPEDQSEENKLRFAGYVQRASYVNFTGHTKDGMLGMVFRKSIELKLPSQIDYIEKNANGGGLSLEQLITDIVGDSLEAGRYGVLVDYPEAEEGLTQAQVNSLGLQANLLPYPFETVINWRTGVFNGIKKLTLVVLKEIVTEVKVDGFGVENVEQYRVLRLTDGVYTQQLYDKDGEPKGEAFTPTKSDRSIWDEIPFIFIGAQNNDETVDNAPLYDLSNVNVAHYRNSADYEESSFIVGQPTFVTTGLTKSWYEDVLEKKLVVGSRNGIALNEGADAKLLQASPNQMPLEGMREKEAQMIMIGARLIQDSSGIETAEAAKIRFAGQNSKLGLIVQNVQSALLKCLAWAGQFMGTDQDAVLVINTDFYDKSVDAQTIVALIQAQDRGTIAQTDLRRVMRRGDLIAEDRTDEDIDKEASILSPITNV